jgi:hypothetical protein
MVQMRRSLPVLILTLLVGCDSISDPELPIESGVISLNGDTSGVLSLPQFATQGTDLEVVVRTFGNGCASAAGMGVRYTSEGAVLTPVDNGFTRIPNGVGCLDLLVRPEHAVRLRFPSPGTFRVHVEGREQPSGRSILISRNLSVLE